MGKILIVVLLILCSCGIGEEIKKHDDEIIRMRNSCPYFLVYNNKEFFYVKEYKLINDGNVKAVYLLQDNTFRFDTITIGGNFTITPNK